MTRKPPRSLLELYKRQTDATIKPQKKRRRRVPASAKQQRAVVQKAAPKIAKAVTKAVKMMQAGTSTKKVREALDTRDLTAAVDAVPLGSGMSSLTTEHAAIFRDAFEAAADIEAATLGTTFDVLNDRSLRAMAEKGGQFVRELGRLQRDELRAMLVQMVDRGLSVREAADLFKESLGLTTRLNAAVLNYREALTARGITGAKLDRMVASKAEKLLRYRARLVAQTEAQNAATAGQLATFAAAEADGLIDLTTFEMEWVTSSQPCPKICDGMDGQRRKLGEMFTTDDGRQVSGPGGEAHPGCLCSLVSHANRKRAAEAA